MNKKLVSFALSMGISGAAFAGSSDASCDAPCKPKPACRPCCVPKPVNAAECGCVNGGPGSPLDCDLVPAAYNKAAHVQIQCGTDFYVTADFLYWQALQDGRDLVSIHLNGVPDEDTETSTDTLHFQNFSYKPAFKVGLGYDSGFDGWGLYAQYTWYHHQFHSSFAQDPINDVFGDNCLTAQYGVGFAVAANTLNAKWKLGIDIADLSAQRVSYIGTNLVLIPSIGLRAAWIRQDLSSITEAFLVDPIVVRTQKYQLHSWAIGPRAGLASSWLLGCGFRLIGNGYASVLYTSYTEVQADFTRTEQANREREYHDNYNALRAMTEFDIGLGWGDYVCDQTYYFDLALTYDFNVFWNQNMMRHLSNQFSAFSADSPGNLYLHGLTLEARLDF